MGIRGDAGELLAFIYDSYINNTVVTPNKLLNVTGWRGDRIDRAIKYLNEIGSIKIIFTLSNISGLQNFILTGLTPIGIEIIENQEVFKEKFGFTINLGLISFSWSSEKKLEK